MNGKPPPAKPIGGIAGIEHGMSETFTANFTPGNYAFICFIPDAKDGKPDSRRNYEGFFSTVVMRQRLRAEPHSLSAKSLE